MRGDLVYEKLGEIDPELLADALPPATVTPPLYQLGSNQPVKSPRGPRIRKVLLICACIALAVLLLAGGAVALYRAWEGFFEETTPEDHYGKELTYGGTVSIEGFGSLTDSDDLVVIGNEVKARFNAAAPVEDVCECDRDLSIQMGETTLTYNRDHGCFRDRDTGKVYLLREQDREYVNDLLDDLLHLPPILTFFCEYFTLRRGDDFVFSVGWFEGYCSIYKIDKVYLRYEGEDTEYVTPGFFTVNDQDTYRIRIKDDAPYGKYTLVAHVYSPYTGRYIEMDIPSATGAIEIVPNEKEPAYSFDPYVYPRPVSYSETLEVDVSVTNLGDDLYVFGDNTVLHPQVMIRAKRGGETITFHLNDCSVDDGMKVHHMETAANGGRALFTLAIDETVPIGMYDLVLSFRGYEEVYEGSVTVTDGQDYPIELSPGESYRFPVDRTDVEYYLELFEYLIPMEIQDGYAVVTIPEDAEGGYYCLWERYKGMDTPIMYEFIYVPEKR